MSTRTPRKSERLLGLTVTHEYPAQLGATRADRKCLRGDENVDGDILRQNNRLTVDLDVNGECTRWS